MAAGSEPELTREDVVAWRKGNWIFVSLAGEVVFRRLTRDRAFTSAWVLFQGGRSPRHARVCDTFRGVELRGGWFCKSESHLSNRIEVPIVDRKRP